MKSSRKSRNIFTEQHSEILKDLVIDPINPGTILKDFNCLVDYIKSHQVTSTKSYNYITLKHLTPINNILSNPLKIRLKRPNKKSFPNISGLFLLLRSIGILRLHYSGKDVYLRINEDVNNMWAGLNNTEAYFTLLETWLIRSNPRDLLDEYRPSYGTLVTTCFKFLKTIPSKGLDIDINKDAEWTLKYLPALYNVALLELFGFVDIVHGEPEIGKGWRIIKIKRNALGDAFFNYLYEKLVSTDDYFEFSLYNELEMKSNIPFGQLQKLFVEFFPEWKKNLKMPKSEFKEGVYIFKVSLGKLWRRIGIQSENTLEDLTDVILDSFDFDKDHLYAFYLKDYFGNNVEINSPDSEEEPFTSEMQIGSTPVEVGSVMKFVFDFGDNWEFEVYLEDIQQPHLKLAVPKIIEKHGDSPEQYPRWDDEYDDFI